MKEDIINNLSKYDKDKIQLKYEKKILEALNTNHSLIKYVHPAIIYKNSKEIIEILGDSKKYLKYIPVNTIKKHQNIIFEYCKYNPELFKYIDVKYYLKREEEAKEIIKAFPLNYDYCDKSLKEGNKELFKNVFIKLFNIKDSYVIDSYYKISINNDRLLHNINRVMLNKDLVMVLGHNLDKVVNYKELTKKIEELSKDKYRFKILIDLLKLYKDSDYVERYIDSLIDLVKKDYYFYKSNGNIISINKDVYHALYKDSLSINEIKQLYYILSNNMIHINSREEFYKFSDIRNSYLSNINIESIREAKDTIFEYNYAMNYEEINGLIDKYSSNIDYLISKYKKYKYNIDEIEEYETLLIFREMININNCNDFNELREILEEAYINHKEIKSYDNRIYLEERIASIYHKEYERIIGKRIEYTNEEKVLYEDIVSKNKQSIEYVGKYVNIKYVNPESFFNMLLRKDISSKYFNTYNYISNEYINVDIDSYYLRVNNIKNRIVRIDMDKYFVPGVKYNNIILEGEQVISIVCFTNKISESVIRKAIDENIIIEIINIKSVVNYMKNLRDSIFKKIIHYIDNKEEYVEDERITKYTPIECVELLCNISNNMIISNNLSKEIFTRNISNIISKIDNIKDNYVLISQLLLVVRKSLEFIGNTFDKKIVYRDLDRLYRKYNLYVRESSDYKDVLVLLESNRAKDIKVFNDYNRNQIEYLDVVDKIKFDKIADYIELLEDNYYRGDINKVIRISIYSNLLAHMIDKELVDLCLLASVYSDIGRLTNIRFGDYSASIFRSIYKNILKKSDIDIVCAVIDYQDSIEDINKIQIKYKIKDIDKVKKISSILKDSIYLDEYKYKRYLINKESTRLLKIKEVVSNCIYDHELEVLIRKRIISKNYYLRLLGMGYTYKEIYELCKKL